MKILVTGAAGFIGFHLINALLKLGYEVTGVDNMETGINPLLMKKRISKITHKNFTFMKLDINDLKQLKSSFDLVINLAAKTGVRYQKNQINDYLQSNINGFIAVCDFCRERKVKNVIYASSSCVYDDSESKPFMENQTKKSPKSLYGLTKLFNETYAQKIHKQNKISFVGLRFFTVYGPFGRPDMAYFSFTDAMKKHKTIMLHNDGKMHRDMTYIDDIIQGISKAIKYISFATSPINEIFNLGCNEPITTADLLKKLSEELDTEPKIETISVENESIFTHADLSKSKSELDYTPGTSFDIGIKNFLNWHKNYE